MIQRYDMEPDCTLEPMNATMEKDGGGEWVKYADHLTALAEKDAELARAVVTVKIALALIISLRCELTRAEQEAARLRALLTDASQWIAAFAYKDGSHSVVIESPRFARYRLALEAARAGGE